MSNLRTQVITTEAEFYALGAQWQQLAELDDESMLFNDWQWNSLWWQHYQHLGNLHVVLVFAEELDGHQLVGIGPFYCNESKALRLGKIHTLRFIGTGGTTSPDNVNILAHPRVREQVAQVICEHLFNEPFQRLLLMDVPENSTFYNAFISHAEAMPGYTLEPTTHDRLYADLPDHWSEYRQQISRNTHKQMKRRFNKLNTLGNVRFNICQTQEELDIAFDALVRLHASRWVDKRQQSGSFNSDDYIQFHKQLMDELLLRSQLWLVTLEIDGVIIAVEYSFLYKQTLMFFQTGFDPDFKHISPGHVLMTYMIQEAIEQGVKRIDLLKGEYEYKTSYATKQIRSSVLVYYAPGLYSFVAKLNDHRLEFVRA